MMNEEKVKILVNYLEILSKLDGNYRIEIASTIKTIEEELKIKNVARKGIKISSDDGSYTIVEDNTLKIYGKNISFNGNKVEANDVANAIVDGMNKMITSGSISI